MSVMGCQMSESFQTDQNGPLFGFLTEFSPKITKQTLSMSLLMLILCLSARNLKAEVKIQKGSSDVNVFNSEEDCAVSLAKYVADLSVKFIQERNTFTVVLSGDTLILTMRKLLEKPYVDSIDWSKWYVFWVDERAVLKTNPQSNYKNAYDNFLSKVPIPSDQIISINDNLISSLEQAAEDYETGLIQLVNSNVIAKSATGFPRFDVMLLGLGLNGHIASLFPDRPQLKEREKWVTYITDSPKPPPHRITMTFPVIDSSSNVAFVVTQSNQAKVVKAALDGNQTSEILPVQMVSLVDGELKWFLDIEAASLLLEN